MNQYIVSTDTVRQSDIGQIGAKAAILGTLAYERYPVLPGLCVTTSALDLALQSCASEINAIVHQQHIDHRREAESVSKAIAELLADPRCHQP